MTSSKLLSSLAIILLIFSCAFLAGPLGAAHNVAISPMATGIPFPFATATPTPSPTPEPTATPIPTPRPEPSAKPTITIDAKSSATASTPKVEISGILSYNKTGISLNYVYVGFSADGGNRWENFSLAQTQSDGSYNAVWIPNATGNYLLCAQYLGNLSLHWMNATINLSMLPDSAGNEFSVVSNSTISNLAYDSATQQLSFSTNGTTGTTGYAQICIPKTLASNAQMLAMEMDGENLAFDSQSLDDIWVISCVYTQSEHAFTVQIPFAEVLSQDQTSWLTIITIIIIGVVVIGVVLVVRRKRRTAAVVAAILKEKRST